MDLGYEYASGPGPVGSPQESGGGWGKTVNMMLQFIMGVAKAFSSGTQIEKVDNGVSHPDSAAGRRRQWSGRRSL